MLKPSPTVESAVDLQAVYIELAEVMENRMHNVCFDDHHHPQHDDVRTVITQL